jgi:putative FmdB family regulatory protein
MPTYAYECKACGHGFEEFQSITAGALRKCPSCGKLKLARLIGPGAGILFKGGGFYETDYRSSSYKAGEKAEKDSQSSAKDSKDSGSKDSGSGDSGSGDSGSGGSGSKSGGSGDSSQSATKQTDKQKTDDS